MVRRIVLSLVTCSLAAACGASPPPASPTTDVAIPAATKAGAQGSAPVATAPVGSRHGASDAIRKAWPFEDPKVVVYADLKGLMRTPVMTEVLRSVIGLAALGATAPQLKCIDDALANVEELAVGSDGGAPLILARVDRSTTKWVGTCILGGLKESKPTTMPGAAEAWSLKTDVAALSPEGLFFLGPRAQVERALSGRSSGASLASVTLGEGEYVAWLARIFDDQPPAKGSVLATEARFRVAGEADVPSETLAQRIEGELAHGSLSAMLPASGMKGEEAQGLARLVNAVEVKRDGRHVAIALDLREPPVKQARDLGVAAALAIYGVRKYLVNAKQAEAKNVLAEVARDIASDWEAEPPDGRPQSKRKLVSYPAVPKAVPKGVKYQSSAADWRPWAPLRFSMELPQYYQYEVKAAKDGETAEIIARGDLNGDGKSSQFRLIVKVERPSNRLRIAPSIEETDPDE